MALETVAYTISADSHSAELFRRAAQSMIAGTGVVGDSDLAVSAQSTPNMSVQVAPGQIWIPGTLSSASGFPTNIKAQTGYGLPANLNEQGSYYAWNNAATNLTIATADPTNPRIDLIVASIQDAQYSGSNNQAVLQVITGTAAPSPAAPTVPAASVVLAQIAVAANATSVTTGNITDQRPGVGLIQGFTPYAIAYDSVGHPIGNGSETQIPLTALQSSNYGMTLASGSLIVPTNGIYQVTATISLHVATNTVADFTCFIGHNSSPSYGSDENAYTAAVGSYVKRQASALVSCGAGDSLQLYGRADSTTTQNTTQGTAATYLHAFRVGPA